MKQEKPWLWILFGARYCALKSRNSFALSTGHITYGINSVRQQLSYMTKVTFFRVKKLPYHTLISLGLFLIFLFVLATVQLWEVFMVSS